MFRGGLIFNGWGVVEASLQCLSSDHRLVSARQRRVRIQAAIDKRNLCSKKIEAAVEKKKDNKFSLSNPPISEIEEKQKCSSSGAKKPGDKKAKMIMPQQ